MRSARSAVSFDLYLPRPRTRVVGAFPDGHSALMLVSVRLRHVAGTRWGTRKYLDMERLAEGRATDRFWRAFGNSCFRYLAEDAPPNASQHRRIVVDSTGAVRRHYGLAIGTHSAVAKS
jgi:hypothetical protein